MKVTLTAKIYGVADGEIYPRWFNPGDVVTGELARSAVEQGCAEIKKKRKPVKPEHLKQYSALQRGRVSRKTTATD